MSTLDRLAMAIHVVNAKPAADINGWDYPAWPFRAISGSLPPSVFDSTPTIDFSGRPELTVPPGSGLSYVHQARLLVQGSNHAV